MRIVQQVLVAAALAALAPTQSDPPIRALLVTGGCCHDYATQKHLITRGISARCSSAIDWTVVHHPKNGTQGEIPIYAQADWHRDFDIVFHNECYARTNDPAWIERIIGPHRAGLPAVVMHCTMHSYGMGRVKSFVDFLGVRSHGHGAHYPYRVEPLQKDHPILASIGDGWQTPKGELYRISEVLPTASPLAHAQRLRQGKETGEYDVCFWTNRFGEGRVFGTTTGHHNETVSDPVYLDTVTRGFLWALGRDGSYRQLVKADAQVVIDAAMKAARDAVAIEVEQPKEAPVAEPAATAGSDVPANLARGRPVTASSEERNRSNFAARGVDGRLGTRWCAANAAPGSWLTVDLGEAKRVRAARIHWEFAGGSCYRYRLEASGDGEVWRTVADRSDATGENGVTLDRFDAPGTRYFRVHFLGNDKGRWGSLWELELYDGDVPPLPANPKKSGPPPGERQESRFDPAAAMRDVKPADGYEVTLFAHPPEVNYPVCVAAAPTGEVFVGVDENGSLGKEDGYGKVLRLVDTDGDGAADEITTFARMRHPRGLFYDAGRLWVLHVPFISVYEDTDGDGVADTSKVLVRGITNETMLKRRGADHTTNGIRVGIDGWIYIAVGDYGFVEAVDADGKKLQLQGGGIARVRPDGTELEVFAQGLRNVCDIAISPQLDLFTRDNTNDGGGWNVRFSHIVQSAHYGYPSLYQRFGSELFPPMQDFGGGSGTGALYVAEPGWPDAHRVLTADWGRSMIYSHPVQRDGATWSGETQTDFLGLARVTDMDVDGSGRMVAASWRNGQFKYAGPDIGFVVRVTPPGWRHEPFPDLAAATDADLLRHLGDEQSHVRRLHAQREILRRSADELTPGVAAIAGDGERGLDARVAAIFTLKQMLRGRRAADALLGLVGDRGVRRWVLQALADHDCEGVPMAPFVAALDDDEPGTIRAAIVGLGRLGDAAAASAILPFVAHRDRAVAHVATKAIVRLRAVEPCLVAVDSGLRSLALCGLRVLRELHSAAAVRGLIECLDSARDAVVRREIVTTLARLHFREGPWNGGWWGTRPDTTGPYFKRATWAQSAAILAALDAVIAGSDPSLSAHAVAQLERHGVRQPRGKQRGEKPAVDIAAVLDGQAGVEGGLGAMSLADAVTATLASNGEVERGERLFTSQGCVACHAVGDAAPKGPMLADITKRYGSRELIESILKPNAVIAQGFATHVVTTKDGAQHTGFVVAEAADSVQLRTILGVGIEVERSAIASRQVLETSMMPEGLMAGLQPADLASLLAYLATL